MMVGLTNGQKIIKYILNAQTNILYKLIQNIFLFKMEPPLNLSDLPPETITELLYNIKDLKTLANLCQTDKRIHAICENNMFWKEKYRRYFQHLPSDVNLSWKEMYKLALLTVPISPITVGFVTYTTIDDQNMLYIGRTVNNISAFQQKVRSVSQASTYIGIVTDDGKVHFWGEKLQIIFNDPIVRKPTEFKIPGKAIKISCGPKLGVSSAMFAVILEDRSVFLRMYYELMGSGPLSPKWGMFSGKLNITGGDGLKRNIKALDISTNGHALAIVSTGGKLYYLGKSVASDANSYPDPRKDIGIIYKDDEIVVNPVHIHLPETIKQVSMDHENICVLSFGGTIYLWGSNDYGQLGKGGKLKMVKFVDKPLKLSFPTPISFITCRYRTTAAIDKNGKLYIWGKHRMSTNPSKYIGFDDILVSSEHYRNSGFNRPIEIGLLHNNTNIESIFNYVALANDYAVATTNDGYVNIWRSGDH